LFAELRSIISKTIGAPSLIAQSLKKMAGIEDDYLYGSFASNELDAASDIDELVIGALPGEALAEAMRKIERQLGREFSYVKGPRPCYSESTTYGGFKSPLSDKKRGVRQQMFPKLFPNIFMAYPFASTALPKQSPTASKYRSAIVDGTESRQRTIGSA
jgi:predicted nucleotidyltransferase